MKFLLKYKFSVIALTLSLVMFFSFCSPKPAHDKVLIELVSYALTRLHYKPHQLDDGFSKRVYESYVEQLDVAKRYLYKSDLREFAAYEEGIDDEIQYGSLAFFDLTSQRIHQRFEEASNIYGPLLDEPFNLKESESWISDPDKIEYAKDQEELKERWRKYLKYNVMVRVSDALEEQDKEAEHDEDYVKKDIAELEEKARTEVRELFDDWFDRMLELERKDWLSVYINAITADFDPHTNYFAPRDKEQFDMSMSGQLEGIGAQLQKKGEYITVSKIISGSPSWKQGDLEVGDKITKVGQAKDEAVSVVGMRLDDAVDMIRGKKGTEVRLTVKKIDGSSLIIPIIRDVVELEETFAKSSVVEKNGKKYGLIHLPKFYVDFDNKERRDCASDMAQEIERLKEEGIQGLILDLRNNGGGSLPGVVKMSGLFIENGPIVQVKSRDSAPQILKDEDPAVQWDGPLVVMVNELSASASEILAAAMQDYERAVIVGSKNTFGKGTVQNMLDLDRMVNKSMVGDDPLGAIKLTIQKFYRVNGETTQLKGVESDVDMPDRYTYIEIGEKEQDNALAWDEIKAVNYNKWTGIADLDWVKKRSEARVSHNSHFQLMDKNAKWLKNRKDIHEISLNLAEFQKENEEFKEEVKKFDALDEYKSGLAFESPKYEELMVGRDSTLRMKREAWHKSLSKDAYVEEAVNVLQDLQ